MRRQPLSALAPVADAVCLAVFVVLGRESHDIDSGIIWYLTVLWPFIAGWFVAAVVLRLYVRSGFAWVALAATWAAGVAIALVLRALVTQRSTPVAFIVVAYAFIGAIVFGWRLAVWGLRALRSRG